MKIFVIIIYNLKWHVNLTDTKTALVLKMCLFINKHCSSKNNKIIIQIKNHVSTKILIFKQQEMFFEQPIEIGEHETF